VKRGAVAVVAQRRLHLAGAVPQFTVKDARRALAVLAHNFYQQPSRRLKVIGVTGTNGKSTTCYVTRSILEAAGRACGLLGTVEYSTGRSTRRAPMTTPDPTVIQALMHEMLEQGTTHAVMVVSSHALDQSRTDCIQFAAAVFTNLTGDHLDYHRTMEAYRQAKARLFLGLEPDSFAILNADDPTSLTFATSAERIWYGLHAERTAGCGVPGYCPPALRPYVCAQDVRCSLEGSRFVLRIFDKEDQGPGRTTRSGPFRSQSLLVSTPLVGKHNVYNALASAAAALSLGCSLHDVRTGLASARPVPGRLEPVAPSDSRQALPFRVLVDYAHTHGGLDSVLSALRPLVSGRLIVVFGAGGDRDTTKRPKMGRAVERWADLAWITSDNPRSENPCAILEEIYAGVRERGKFRKVEDRRLAIQQAISCAGQGDLVVIAGKGHETEQIYRNRLVQFDDRKVAQEVLDHKVRHPACAG
jgi:UDP-N-acetylmuramoyl-L-alanyl-D-glutamate--2,6-diaminopimelate ligase